MWNKPLLIESAVEKIVKKIKTAEQRAQQKRDKAAEAKRLCEERCAAKMRKAQEKIERELSEVMKLKDELQRLQQQVQQRETRMVEKEKHIKESQIKLIAVIEKAQKPLPPCHIPHLTDERRKRITEEVLTERRTLLRLVEEQRVAEEERQALLAQQERDEQERIVLKTSITTKRTELLRQWELRLEAHRHAEEERIKMEFAAEAVYQEKLAEEMVVRRRVRFQQEIEEEKRQRAEEIVARETREEIEEREYQARLAREVVQRRIQDMWNEMEAAFRLRLEDPHELRYQQLLAEKTVEERRVHINHEWEMRRQKKLEEEAEWIRVRREMEIANEQRIAQEAMAARQRELVDLRMRRELELREQWMVEERTILEQFEIEVIERHRLHLKEVEELRLRREAEEREEAEQLRLFEEEGIEEAIVLEIRRSRPAAPPQPVIHDNIEVTVEKEIKVEEERIVKEAITQRQLHRQSLIAIMRKQHHDNFQRERERLMAEAVERGENVVGDSLYQRLCVIGGCPNNYYWIRKPHGGYICAGGAHELSEEVVHPKPDPTPTPLPEPAPEPAPEPGLEPELEPAPQPEHRKSEKKIFCGASIFGCCTGSEDAPIYPAPSPPHTKKTPGCCTSVGHAAGACGVAVGAFAVGAVGCAAAIAAAPVVAAVQGAKALSSIDCGCSSSAHTDVEPPIILPAPAPIDDIVPPEPTPVPEPRPEPRKPEEIILSLGRCPFNYKWRKEEHGYRCEGGSHVISALEIDEIQDAERRSLGLLVEDRAAEKERYVGLRLLRLQKEHKELLLGWKKGALQTHERQLSRGLTKKKSEIAFGSTRHKSMTSTSSFSVATSREYVEQKFKHALSFEGGSVEQRMKYALLADHDGELDVNKETKFDAEYQKTLSGLGIADASAMNLLVKPTHEQLQRGGSNRSLGSKKQSRVHPADELTSNIPAE